MRASEPGIRFVDLSLIFVVLFGRFATIIIIIISNIVMCFVISIRRVCANIWAGK